MVPFEEAKAQAVAAAERWNTQLAAVTAERDAAIEDRDSWRHAEQTFREETEEKEKDAAESLAIVAAQLAALKKRVADAPKAMTYRPNGEGAYIPAVDVADGGTYALLRLEDGE